MIFKELVFKDFLTFKGKNVLKFPDPAKHDKSLVLVLAPNYAGKTNVIRALEFLIYGELKRNRPASELELVNKAYLAEAKPGSASEAWVAATIMTGGEKPITFRRRIVVGPGGKSASVGLEMIKHERDGDKYSPGSETLERTLAELVPQSLFDYFYFEGETLASQLISGGQGAIHRGLETLLHKDEWKLAIENVGKVSRQIFLDIEKIGAASSEYNQQAKKIELIQSEIDFRRKGLEEEKKIEKQALDEYHRLNEQIQALGRGKGAQHEKLNEAIEKARRDFGTESRALERIESRLCEVVGGSRGVSFFGPACVPAQQLLREMQDQNILPADVSEGFVKRLLRADHCICGRPLLPEAKYAKERKCIEEYLARTLAIDLNSGLMRLFNMMEKGASNSLQGNMADLEKELSQLIGDRMKTIVREKDLQEEVRALEEKRAQSNVVEIAALQAKQNQAKDKQTRASNKQTEHETVLKVLQANLKREKSALENMVHGAAQHKLKKLDAMQKMADELKDLIAESLNVLMASFRASLQESIACYYDQNTRDGSTAVINADLLPSVREKSGEVLRVLGGAQRQLLVLAHIISLAELRRGLHQQLDTLGIKVGKLDDQSFFLDSIFAPCDPNMAGIVANFLPNRARQMLVLVAKQQWYKEIQGPLEKEADKIYGFCYHTPKKPEREEEFVVEVGKSKVKLFALLKGGTSSYTSIQELK